MLSYANFKAHQAVLCTTIPADLVMETLVISVLRIGGLGFEETEDFLEGQGPKIRNQLNAPCPFLRLV